MIVARRYSKMVYLMMLALAGCLEPYQPPITNNNPELLVVDAFIFDDHDSAGVSLSRTVTLDSEDIPRAELGAKVTVEDESGQAYSLAEKGQGQYALAKMNLNGEEKYRLRITTTENKEYLSDWTALKKTPPIDKLYWGLTEDGVEIYLDTSDPDENSHYYRWGYSETWKYHAPYEMTYRLVNGEFQSLEPDELMYYCWREVAGTKVLVATTNRLQYDVVNRFRITFIPKESIKISNRYSILVQQQTLSEEGYNYWLNLQKTTENLGGLFDPLPSEVVGNIHCITNPEESVIGYFDGATITEKRLFIDSSELPRGYSSYPHTDCIFDSVFFENPAHPTESANIVIGPIIPAIPEPISVIGYITTSPVCVDCRIFGGGTTTKPAFWE